MNRTTHRRPTRRRLLSTMLAVLTIGVTAFIGAAPAFAGQPNPDSSHPYCAAAFPDILEEEVDNRGIFDDHLIGMTCFATEGASSQYAINQPGWSYLGELFNAANYNGWGLSLYAQPAADCNHYTTMPNGNSGLGSNFGGDLGPYFRNNVQSIQWNTFNNCISATVYDTSYGTAYKSEHYRNTIDPYHCWNFSGTSNIPDLSNTPGNWSNRILGLEVDRFSCSYNV